MVMIKEFRITMPFSMDEYRVGQTYMRSRMQRENTRGGSEGVEVVACEPFEDKELGSGHFSHVVYHFGSRAPAWIRALAPAESLQLVEKNWSAFPRMRTEITCPYFSKFRIVTDSFHVAGLGESDNALNLSPEDLAIRKVDNVDIASGDRCMWSRIIARKPTDPSKIALEKLQRGPLKAGWQSQADPVMTVYKVVRVDAPYWACGKQMEYATMAAERALYLEAHRKVYGWADDWCELTVADARRIERDNIEAMQKSFNSSDAGSSSSVSSFDDDAFDDVAEHAEDADEEGAGFAMSAPVVPVSVMA